MMKNINKPVFRFVQFISTIIFILSQMVTVNVYAQDTHYWNIQYGTKPILLGGAVIGSVSDLSATYYNPGAISLFKDKSFLLSAKSFQLDIISIKDGAGEDRDLVSTTFAPAPSLVAFEFDIEHLKEDRFVISLLTRQLMDSEFRARVSNQIDVDQSVPGKEDFSGAMNFDEKLTEVWAGLTYAFQAGENVGLGFTWYFAYRNQRLTNSVTLSALDTTGNIGSLTDIQDYNYFNVRTLGKLGIGINLNPLSIGLSVTTPSLNLLGNGSTGFQFFLDEIDLDGDNNGDNIFNSNFQDDINSSYKSSWAIGVGGAYGWNKIKLHFSAEWYDDVDEFTVLTTEPFLSQDTGERLNNDLTNELKSVFNYGFGIDYRVSSEITVSGAIVTDFSAFVPNTTTNLSISSWDIYHISGGTTFKVGKSDITLGLSLSLGSEKFVRILNLPNSGNSESDIIYIKTTDASLTRINVLFGFLL